MNDGNKKSYHFCYRGNFVKLIYYQFPQFFILMCELSYKSLRIGQSFDGMYG